MLKHDYRAIAVDNFNAYYEVNLKKSRLSNIEENKNFTFCKVGLENRQEPEEVFLNNEVDYIVNLAAQAGVRYSIENPADVDALMKDVGYKPATSIEHSIGTFIDWYKEYYNT